MIKLAFYDENLNMVEKGEFAIHHLDEWLNEWLANSLLDFENAKKTMSNTNFCLYRDDRDFCPLMF